MLFNRGKAISGALINIGTNQLPNPPIIVGMTKKKIITKACEVTTTLYNWSSPNNLPVIPNSKRIMNLKADPKKADHKPNRKYKVPISLWLVEYIQRILTLFRSAFLKLRTKQRFTITYLTGKGLWDLDWNYKFDVYKLQQMLNYMLCYTFMMLAIIYVNGSIYLTNLIQIGVSFDAYSVWFITLLGVIRIRVLFWSYYYMDCEVSYDRFFYLVVRFISSMIILILFSNLFTVLIGWDGLGITSFLLVIFYKNRKRLGSGLLTAFTNRIGDCLYLCLLGLTCYHRHVLWTILFVLLSITKRAQFPFSRWLPAAIAAPTPVSALVHSSTLVTAGVYILIRFYLYCSDLLLCIGCITLLLASMSACIERDLKKVVALSTLSQLGVMMVAIGAEEKAFCFFHLMSHAMFKALIFLCVGTCLHSFYGTQDYRRFGNGAPMYVSHFLTVANLSLLGFVFTSGFYRKEIILEITYKTSAWVVGAFLLGIGLTTCYSSKISSVLFHDSIRNKRLGGYHMKWPLWILGTCSILYGRVGNKEALTYNFSEKYIPFLFICVGLIMGYFIRRNSSISSSIFTLIPITQRLARYKLDTSIEILRTRTKSFAIFNTFTHRHFNVVICLGLLMLLLFYV